MAIDPDKDVDGFHPTNFGKMSLNSTNLYFATPSGILELLKKIQKHRLEGKNTVVLGRSDIVGKPISMLMGLKTNSQEIRL